MIARINGIDLHYTVAGTGDPLLFIHGFPLSGAVWTPLIEWLGGLYKMIIPDMRGAVHRDNPSRCS